jgi:glycosyltransferase involved in cell wall biosynthesis
METESIWIIMPVYNEEASVRRVFDEWLPLLRSSTGNFKLATFNDGSRDRTAEILHDVAARNPEVLVFDKPNSGHGQTCLLGYRTAIEAGARWIFQIDSDGQCDPRFFPAIWGARNNSPAIFGRRVIREDGRLRSWMSRVVSVVGWLASGQWVADPNVPYRLIRADILADAIAGIPANFRLANVLVAIRLQRRVGIRWLPITFRDRYGGSPAVKGSAFVRHGALLLTQLLNERLHHGF